VAITWRRYYTIYVNCGEGVYIYDQGFQEKVTIASGPQNPPPMTFPGVPIPDVGAIGDAGDVLIHGTGMDKPTSGTGILEPSFVEAQVADAIADANAIAAQNPLSDGLARFDSDVDSGSVVTDTNVGVVWYKPGVAGPSDFVIRDYLQELGFSGNLSIQTARLMNEFYRPLSDFEVILVLQWDSVVAQWVLINVIFPNQ